MDWTLLYIITIILILPCFIYGVITQNGVYSTFEKFSKVSAKSGITASELSQKLLNASGIDNVEVVNIDGKLTDCYDSKHKVVKLSTSTYLSSSVSALGVCAHEIGHAVQDKNKNVLFKIRTFLVPILNFFTRAFVPLILIGSILSFGFYLVSIGYYIIWASVILYGLSFLFYLVTLSLEFDASKKALKLLEETGTLDSEELDQAKKVLSAAAKTYIAAFLTSLLYFLRFLSYAMIFARRE